MFQSKELPSKVTIAVHNADVDREQIDALVATKLLVETVADHSVKWLRCECDDGHVFECAVNCTADDATVSISIYPTVKMQRMPLWSHDDFYVSPEWKELMEDSSRVVPENRYWQF